MKYVIEDTTLTGIADAIREKTETTEGVPVLEMRPKILGITSGGMTASIFVTGLRESDIVTASNGDKTKVAVWNSTENRHEITGIGDKGMWTVTATNGEDTVTQDVLVDGAFDYEIEMEMSRKLWLYREGDECEAVTGGWSADGYGFYSGYTNYPGEKNEDNMFFALRGTHGTYPLSCTNLGTNNSINLSGYSKVYMEYKNTTLGGSQAVHLYICSNKSNIVGTIVASIQVADGSVDRVTHSADIALDGAYYINVGASNGRAGYCYNVWLE